VHRVFVNTRAHVGAIGNHARGRAGCRHPEDSDGAAGKRAHFQSIEMTVEVPEIAEANLGVRQSLGSDR